jgi:hypothetical protein
MLKLMSFFILLFSSHLMAGETCTPQGDLIISSERTGAIEALNTPLNNLVCTGKIREESFNYEFISPLVEKTKEFCTNNPANQEFCVPGTEIMKPFVDGTGQRFLEYVRQYDQALATQAESKMGEFLCFYSLMQEVLHDVMNDGNIMNVSDAKAKIDFIFATLDNKSAADLVSATFSMWQNRMTKDHQKEKFSYIIEKLRDRQNIQQDDKIHETLERIAKSTRRRLPDEIRLKALNALGKLAERGDAKARGMVEGFTTQIENEAVKLRAEGIMAYLGTLPEDDQRVGGDPIAPLPRMAPTPIAESTPITEIPITIVPTQTLADFAPPQCGDETVPEQRESLFISESDYSIFQSYFESKHSVNLSSMIEEGQNAYEFIISKIHPDLEDDEEKTKWKDFVDDFVAQGSSADEEKRRNIARQVYCRSGVLQMMTSMLSAKPGNKEEKISNLQFLNQLPPNDAWYLIQKTIGENDDPNVLKEYLELIKDLGGNRAEAELDKLFARVPSMRSQIIEAFTVENIKLKSTSPIIAELEKIKTTPEGQAMVQRVVQILESEEEARQRHIGKKTTLDSLAELSLSDFTHRVKSNFLSQENASKSKEELNTIIAQETEKKDNAQARIREIQEEILKIQRGDAVGDHAQLISELRTHGLTIRTANQRITDADMHKRLKELAQLEAGSDEFERQKRYILTAISADLSAAESSTADEGNMEVLLAIKRMVIDDAHAGSDSPPRDDSSDTDIIGGNGDDITIGNGGNDSLGGGNEDDTSGNLSGTIAGSGNGVGTNINFSQTTIDLPQTVVKDPPRIEPTPGNIVSNPDTRNIGPAITDDGRISRDEVRTGENKEPVVPVVTDNNSVQDRPTGRTRPVGGRGTADVTAGAIVKSDDDAAPVRLADRRPPRPVAPIVASGNVDSEDVAVEKSNYEIDFIDSNENKPQVVAKAKSAPSQNFAEKKASNQEFTRTQLAVENSAASNNKADFKTGLDNEIKNEIADLQNEINDLKTTNSELKTQQLEEQFEKAVSNNGNSGGQINRNLAAVTPSKAGVTTSGRNPASAPIGEGGSSGGFAGSGGSVRAPSSNGEKLERSVLKDGQIDISSIGTRFVKDLDDKEAKAMGAMSVLVKNKDHEQHLLSLLSNPETATCSDLKFLDVFFKEHIAKVKFNKQGDAELLVKSGNIPLRVIKPSEKRVKALQDKYCAVAQSDSKNTRHTASIGADLDDLPEEGSEAVKPIERKRSKSGALGKIIDGIKGFFD